MSTSSIIGFYRHSITDHCGRSLEDIRRFTFSELEANHDYIQWLFPLPEGSAVNPSAPLLSAVDIAAFTADAHLRGELRRSLTLMLRFWGMTLEDGPRVAPAADFVERAAVWLTPCNHNYLRLTRALRCCTLLGLADEARALEDALQSVAAMVGPDVIPPLTREYWRGAVEV